MHADRLLVVGMLMMHRCMYGMKRMQQTVFIIFTVQKFDKWLITSSFQQVRLKMDN